MVTFYADWCPYCKTFDPEYEAASNDTRLKDKLIKFAGKPILAVRDDEAGYITGVALPVDGGLSARVG